MSSGIKKVRDFQVAVPGKVAFFSEGYAWASGEVNKPTLAWFYGFRENVSLEKMESVCGELPETLHSSLSAECWPTKAEVVQKACDLLRKAYANEVRDLAYWEVKKENPPGRKLIEDGIVILGSENPFQDNPILGARHILWNVTGLDLMVEEMMGSEVFRSSWSATASELT